MKQFFLILSLVCITVLSLSAQEPSPRETFRNPVLKWGPDPHVTVFKKRYYLLHTQGSRIDLKVTEDITDADNAKAVQVFVSSGHGPNAADIWAPEMHRMDGGWHIYYTATTPDHNDGNRRIFVLRNPNTYPEKGGWEDLGALQLVNNRFAIDGSVFEYRNRPYFTWSTKIDGQQCIAVARMETPVKLASPEVIISRPRRWWEVQGLRVNEGPAALKNGKNMFIVFSASFYRSEQYCLGLLRLRPGGDPLKPEDWTKLPGPVFGSSGRTFAYGPGHNCFFRSPDDTEWWICYHARPRPYEGNIDKRSIRIQPFTWDKDGFPVFGEPVSCDKELSKPSGQKPNPPEQNEPFALTGWWKWGKGERSACFNGDGTAFSCDAPARKGTWKLLYGKNSEYEIDWGVEINRLKITGEGKTGDGVSESASFEFPTKKFTPLQSAGRDVKQVMINTEDGWHDTKIAVKKGQIIRITSKGEWSPDGGTTKIGPEGIHRGDWARVSFVKETAHGALLAYISSSPEHIMEIGEKGEFPAPSDGTVFIGVNDRNITDNIGNLFVWITY